MPTRGTVFVSFGLLLLLSEPAPSAAQIYTRVTGKGVIEATNVPASSDFRLTYPGKGTLIHSRGFSRRYRGQFDRHILAASAAFGVAGDLSRR